MRWIVLLDDPVRNALKSQERQRFRLLNEKGFNVNKGAGINGGDISRSGVSKGLIREKSRLRRLDNGYQYTGGENKDRS